MHKKWPDLRSYRQEPHPSKHPILSFFLPFPFLKCCAILPTSFGGKGSHLWRWLVAQPLHQTVSYLRFSGVFIIRKANAMRSVHSPRDHFIIILSLATSVTDATLGASGLWLGTRTGAGDNATLAKSFLAATHGSMDNRSYRRHLKIQDPISDCEVSRLIKSFRQYFPTWIQNF